MANYRTEAETQERDNYEATSREGSKRNVKGKRKGKKMTTKPSSNDVRWHASDDQLLKDAASLAFAYPSGHELVIGGKAVDLPGICTIDVFPAVGKALTFSDPINVAANKVYSFVRHANSGHSNYDAPDLMLYLLSGTSLYSEIMWAQRIYAWAFTYSQRNEYIGRAILQAMGVDYDEVIHHLADFRADLNVAISKISSIMLPSNMPVFEWMAFLYKDVYIDGPSIKDQLYFYRPGAFFDFEYDVDEKVPGLVLKTIDYTTPLTTSNIIGIINASIDAILDQEDFGIMGGDILKAYGTEGLLGITYIPEMLAANPLFDETVLHQFKNATLFKFTTYFNGSVKQDVNSNCLQAGYVANATEGTDAYKDLEHLAEEHILTVDLEAPTPGDVMEVTRLMASATKVKQADDTYNFELVCGTAVASNMRFWWFSGTGTTRRLISSAPFNGRTGMSVLGLALMSRFKYIPAVYAYANTDPAQVESLVFDVDNFVPMNVNDVLKVHRAATLHEYHVDSVAMVTKAQ